jgi:serine protease AprX
LAIRAKTAKPSVGGEEQIMPHILRVRIRGEQQEEVVRTALELGLQVVERYESFVLLESPEPTVPLLPKTVRGVDDLTERYKITIPGRRGRSIDTSLPRLDDRGVTNDHPDYGDEPPPSEDPHHYIVQFKGPIKPEWLAAVDDAGAVPRASLGDFALVVRADKTAIDTIAALEHVRWVGHLPNRDRIVVAPRRVRSVAARPGPPRLFAVEFFGPEDAAAAKAQLAKTPGLQVLEAAPGSRLLTVEIGEDQDAEQQLQKLAAVHGVRQIRLHAVGRLSNDVAAPLMGVAAVVAPVGGGGLGLSGRGERVAICDSGLDKGDRDDIHPDFCGRVADIKSFRIAPAWDRMVTNPGADDGAADTITGHGTHVAGSVLGSGAVSARIPGLPRPIRGLAPRATLYFQAVQQAAEPHGQDSAGLAAADALLGLPADPKGLFEDAMKNDASIFVMSWALGDDQGAYTSECGVLDEFVWANPGFCIVAAAGNEGYELGGGQIAGETVLPLATAKNCITVGACESNRPRFRTTYAKRLPNSGFQQGPYGSQAMAGQPDRVAPFSGRGPTDSGRLKPDVVAPGTYILSVRSRALKSRTGHFWAPFTPSPGYYAYLGGTSQAAALVGGAAALVRQYLRWRRRIAAPTAALIKAALIAGATRLPDPAAARGTIVDDQQGYGRVNLDTVLAPAPPVTARFLDGDVLTRQGQVIEDEIVVRSSAPLRIVLAYSDMPGEKLVNDINLLVSGPRREYFGNRGPQDLQAPDFEHNVEVVHEQHPPPGRWRIEVIAASLPYPPQPFALVYIGDLVRR